MRQPLSESKRSHYGSVYDANGSRCAGGSSSGNDSSGIGDLDGLGDVSTLSSNYSMLAHGSPIGSSSGGRKRKSKRTIGTGALAVLVFYCVTGGPFGIEEIVKASGSNLYALLGFVLMLVWSAPEALITAELSTLLPESSGSVAWVGYAFGDFWAFQKGWLSWLSGVSDNALYPILFLDCFLELMTDSNGHKPLSDDESATKRYILIIVMTLSLSYLNYRGLEVVGKVAICICIFALTPFVVFCVVGVFKVDPSRWLQTPSDGLKSVNWRLLLNTFFWNINFWESAAAFSGEVKNPSYTYPRGMLGALLLVFLTLFLPILIGTGISRDSPDEWEDGYFVRLGTEAIGPWMGYWMILASAVTNIGSFEAEMSSDSITVAGMAEKGILPKVLAKRNDNGAPVYGILLSSSGIIILGTMSFNNVIDMLNLLYCFGQIIEFAAYLKIRKSEPVIDGVASRSIFNLSFTSMVVVLLFPLAFVVVILYLSSTASLVVTFVLTLAGFAIYYLLQYLKANKIVNFNDEYHNLSTEEAVEGVGDDDDDDDDSNSIDLAHESSFIS